MGGGLLGVGGVEREREGGGLHSTEWGSWMVYGVGVGWRYW